MKNERRKRSKRKESRGGREGCRAWSLLPAAWCTSRGSHWNKLRDESERGGRISVSRVTETDGRAGWQTPEEITEPPSDLHDSISLFTSLLWSLFITFCTSASTYIIKHKDKRVNPQDPTHTHTHTHTVHTSNLCPNSLFLSCKSPCFELLLLCKNEEIAVSNNKRPSRLSLLL